MSIFKQSFPKWIQSQLKLRQDLQATGTNGGFKSNEALVWNQTKQCVIRARSLVDYVENVNLDMYLAYDDNGKITETGVGGTLQEAKFESLNGPQLAQRFVLQGGIPRHLASDSYKQRGGIFGGLGSAYGDPSLGAYGSNVDGFGQVPMPGITGLDIATKSAYGSLRQAKLSFVVHNLRQLEILELLYMRPGYPVLIEWQWSPYIHSEDGIQTIEHNIPDDIVFPKGGGKVKQENIYTQILKGKKESEGNYDGFLGFVTNFGFSAREDGGFDCYSEIVSMGEALDSLKLGSSSTVLERLAPGKNFSFKLRDNDEEIKNPDILRAILLAMAKFTGTINTGGAEEEWTLQFFEDNDESGELADLIVSQILKRFPPLQDANRPLTQEQKLSQLKKYVLRKDEDTKAGQFNGDLNAGYITWELLAFLLNELVIPRPSGDESPQLNIVTRIFRNDPTAADGKKVELLQYVRFRGGDNDDIADISCDPGVCLLPHTFFDPKLAQLVEVAEERKDQEQGFLEDTWEGLVNLGNWAWNIAEDVGEVAADWYNNEAESELQIDGDNVVLEPNDILKYYIGGIWLNTKMLLEAYDSSIKGNKEADLGDFFKAVWDKVNEACPLHNFIFQINPELPNEAYVLDLPVDNDVLNDIKDQIFELEVQSSKSVVREYNLEATVPDALKSTVAVHAQNPDTTEDLDDLTFQAFNRAIKNRLFIPPETPPTPEELEAQREREREARDAYENSEGAKEDKRLGISYEESKTPLGKAKKRYLLAAEKFVELAGVYWSIININKNDTPSDADDKINDLKTTIKELQTATLQLEQLKNKTLNTSAVIPLEFNVTFDGISNMIIGSVFKIRADRLPKAYGPSTYNSPGGANVAFIVFKEEQSITAGQDWVTKIGGKMIMLPNENHGQKVAEPISKVGEKPVSPSVSSSIELPPPLIINNELALPDNTFVVPPNAPIELLPPISGNFSGFGGGEFGGGGAGDDFFSPS